MYRACISAVHGAWSVLVERGAGSIGWSVEPHRLSEPEISSYIQRSVSVRDRTPGHPAGELHGIGPDREHNGYVRGRGLGSERGRGRAARGNHSNPTGDQIGRERRQAVELIVGPAEFNGGVPALHEAGRTEPLTEAKCVRVSAIVPSPLSRRW
jgi:hypothetical protein